MPFTSRLYRFAEVLTCSSATLIELVTQIGQEPRCLCNSPSSTAVAALAGRQIVVAIDRSECSLNALKWALEELYRSNDTIHIVRCLCSF